MTETPETQLAPVHCLSSAQEGGGQAEARRTGHVPLPPLSPAGFTVRVAGCYLGCQLKLPQGHFSLPIFYNLCAPGLRGKPSQTGVAG